MVLSRPVLSVWPSMRTFSSGNSTRTVAIRSSWGYVTLGQQGLAGLEADIILVQSEQGTLVGDAATERGQALG